MADSFPQHANDKTTNPDSYPVNDRSHNLDSGSVLTSRQDRSPPDTHAEPMPILYPDDLVGRTFLLDPQEDGQRFRARVVASIDNHNTKVQDNPELNQFK